MSVDGYAFPKPEPIDSTPSDDALTDLLKAMRDSVEERRELSLGRQNALHS